MVATKPTQMAQVDDADLRILCREAAARSNRLLRDLRLPAHWADDLRQELLLDLLLRIKRFDPRRGSLGAFAGKLTKNRASRLAKQIWRQQHLFVSVNELPPGLRSRLESVFCDDPGAESDRAIDRARSQSVLSEQALSLYTALTASEESIGSIAARPSRATFHRRLREIRLTLMMAGLAASR